MSNRPTDILLPQGWDWDRVEQHRARYGVGDDMVPETAYGSGPVTAWGTIGWQRWKRNHVPAGEVISASGAPFDYHACRWDTAWKAETDAYWEHWNTSCCHNAEPGTFGHECGDPAVWVGISRNGHRSGFCQNCRDHGAEARGKIAWEPVPAWAPRAIGGEVLAQAPDPLRHRPPLILNGEMLGRLLGRTTTSYEGPALLHA